MAARKRAKDDAGDEAIAPLPRTHLTEEERVEVVLLAATPPDPETRTKLILKHLARGLGSMFKSSVERLVTYAVVGFVVGWLFNVVVIAVGYDGYGKVPLGGPATGSTNHVGGMVFCFITTALLVMLVNQYRKVGRDKFWDDVRGFPAQVRILTLQDAGGAAQHALWGLAGSMLVIAFIGPWIVGVAAAGFLVGVVGIFRPLLTGVVMIAWQWLGRTLGRPGMEARPPGSPAMIVVTLGGLGAVAVGMLVPAQDTKLLVAAGAGVGAFALSRRQVTAPRAAMLMAISFAVMLALRALAVHASDGGYYECSGDLFNCPGLDQDLREALWGAGAAALGAVVGDEASQAADDWPDGEPEPP